MIVYFFYAIYPAGITRDTQMVSQIQKATTTSAIDQIINGSSNTSWLNTILFTSYSRPEGEKQFPSTFCIP